MADRSRLDLPVEFARAIRSAGRRLDTLLPVDFGEAEAAAEEELALLRSAERATDRDLHKGHPLYNIGVTRYPRNPEDALRHFEAAYVEDARTYRAPNQHLAARVVKNLFGIPPRLLGRLLARAFPDVRRDPLLVADEVQLEVAAGAFEPLFPESQPDDWLLHVSRDDLVFVGGSYRSAGDRIFQIAEQIDGCGLYPAIVGLLKRRPGETDRQKSFRILDMCGLAAFDGSVQEQPGWWAEVERIVQVHQIPTLVAYFSGRGSPYRTSGMFPTPADHPELAVKPFGRNLDLVVRSWIREVHPDRLECDGGNHSLQPKSGKVGYRFISGSNTSYLPRIEPSGSNVPLPGSATPSSDLDE